jgi:DNA-binding NtrC family response regulator
MRRTHLYEKIGDDHIHPTMAMAAQAIDREAHAGSSETCCPLREVVYAAPDMFEMGKPVMRDVGVLVAAGESDERTVTADKLRKMGLRARACSGIEEIHEAMDERCHEVVVATPELWAAEDGRSLVDFCSKKPEMKLILLSDNGGPVDLPEGLSCAVEYLPRASSIEDLTKAINRAAYEVRSVSRSAARRQQ